MGYFRSVLSVHGLSIISCRLSVFFIDIFFLQEAEIVSMYTWNPFRGARVPASCPPPSPNLHLHSVGECGMNIFKSLKTKWGQSSNFWFIRSGLISNDHSTDAVKFQLGNKPMGSISPSYQALVLLGFILTPRQSVDHAQLMKLPLELQLF